MTALCKCKSKGKCESEFKNAGETPACRCGKPALRKAKGSRSPASAGKLRRSVGMTDLR
jgi:hypothetical protein